MYISYYNLDDDDDDEGVVGVVQSSWLIACLVEGEGVVHQLDFQKPVF